jgi:hypothetical protein
MSGPIPAVQQIALACRNRPFRAPAVVLFPHFQMAVLGQLIWEQIPGKRRGKTHG